jgi:hypothetical protein
VVSRTGLVEEARPLAGLSFQSQLKDSVDLLPALNVHNLAIENGAGIYFCLHLIKREIY